MGFVVNGTIQMQTVTGGGYDTNGDPVPAAVSWSDPIPCNSQTIAHRNDGRYVDGEFTQSSYRVFFEMCDPNDEFHPKRIKLTRYGKDLGEWQVQDVDPKPKTGRIQVTV